MYVLIFTGVGALAGALIGKALDQKSSTANDKGAVESDNTGEAIPPVKSVKPKKVTKKVDKTPENDNTIDVGESSGS